MSITAYVGLPGHGKSYGVVANVVDPALKAKRVVYTNIPMNRDICLERFEMSVVQFETQDLIDNPKWFDEVFEKGSVIIIDELWRLWPAGLKANQAEESHKSFLAEHRHMVGESGHSTEIVFVTQDLSQIASFSRSLVETTYRVVKMSKVGYSSRFRVDVFSGSVTGSSPPISKREREIHGKFNKKIYALYKSHTKSDVGAGIETRTDSRYNILKGSNFLFILGGLVFCISMVLWLGSSFFNKGLFADKNEQSKPDKVKLVNSSGVPSVPVKPKSKSKHKLNPYENDLLSKSDSVFYVSKQNFKFDGKNSVIHTFKVNFNDSYTYLTQYELKALKYNVQIVNECLALITGYDKLTYALCENIEESKGFIEETVLASN